MNIVDSYLKIPFYYQDLIPGNIVTVIEIPEKYVRFRKFYSEGEQYEVSAVKQGTCNCRPCNKNNLNIILKTKDDGGCATCNVVLGNILGIELKNKEE